MLLVGSFIYYLLHRKGGQEGGSVVSRDHTFTTFGNGSKCVTCVSDFNFLSHRFKGASFLYFGITQDSNSGVPRLVSGLRCVSELQGSQRRCSIPIVVQGEEGSWHRKPQLQSLGCPPVTAVALLCVCICVLVLGWEEQGK